MNGENMSNKLAKFKLEMKDYATRQRASVEYNGEVVSLDSDLKTYLYRFFETDAGTLMIGIDFSKEKIIITETNDNVKMRMELSLDETGKCTYRLDADHSMNLFTKTFILKLTEEEVVLEYDLYDSDKLDKPVTANKVTITAEREKLC
jgi:hypothetical protein